MTKAQCIKMHEVKFRLLLTPRTCAEDPSSLSIFGSQGSGILSCCMPYQARLDCMALFGRAVGNWELRDATWTVFGSPIADS
jgi:hypothetical protein